MLIGKYEITDIQVPDGKNEDGTWKYKPSLFIRNESAEGMGCDVDALEAVIDKFYTENI